MLPTLVNFLYAYRLHIIVGIFTLWAVYALHRIGKLRKPFFLRKPGPPLIGLPPEQQLVQSETEKEKLQKENERLTLAVAKMKRRDVEKQITMMAENKIAGILPDKTFLFDPANQLTGRPLFFLGGVPTIQKSNELTRLVERHPLNKISNSLTRFICDKLYFKSETLYFYTAQLLPNGKWAITATSKPARKTRKHMKLPLFCQQYILLTSQKQNIDQLILNRWEATHAKAAIHLAATFLGPYPIEDLAELHKSTGWDEHERN